MELSCICYLGIEFAVQLTAIPLKTPLNHFKVKPLPLIRCFGQFNEVLNNKWIRLSWLYRWLNVG